MKLVLAEQQASILYDRARDDLQLFDETHFGISTGKIMDVPTLIDMVVKIAKLVEEST